MIQYWSHWAVNCHGSFLVGKTLFIEVEDLTKPTPLSEQFTHPSDVGKRCTEWYLVFLLVLGFYLLLWIKLREEKNKSKNYAENIRLSLFLLLSLGLSTRLNLCFVFLSWVYWCFLKQDYLLTMLGCLCIEEIYCSD